MSKIVKTAKSKPRSAIMEAVHEGASDLFSLGFIDKRRMQEYDALCLEPIPDYDSQQIKRIRTKLKLSQPNLLYPKEGDMGMVEKSSGNVYEDLGLPNASEMQIKAALVAKIGEIIKHRHLTQVEASEILGMPQPKLSGLLRGQFRGIGEAKMLECLNRLGRDVEIVIRKPSRSKTSGLTRVVFA